MPENGRVRGKAAGKSAARRAKRRALAEATWRVFLRKGLAGTTARAIAAETGRSSGSLYTYYPSTASVVRELALGSLGELARRVAKAIGPGTGPRDRITGAVEQMLEFYGPGSRGAELLPVLMRTAPGDDGGEFAARVNGKLIAALAPVVDAYRGAGLPKDRAEAKALGLGCFVLGLVMMNSTGRLAQLGVGAKVIVAEFLAGTIPP